jgi:hypothetical protein
MNRDRDRGDRDRDRDRKRDRDRDRYRDRDRDRYHDRKRDWLNILPAGRARSVAVWLKRAGVQLREWFPACV